jgi:hypothetical protein
MHSEAAILMTIFRLVPVFLFLSPALLPFEPADAGVTRVSILLTGEGCAVQRKAVADGLNKVPGIIFIDDRSVPDHLLIDVGDGTSTPEQLVYRVNDMLASTSCKAEEMKSCITAELPFSHSSSPHR